MQKKKQPPCIFFALFFGLFSRPTCLDGVLERGAAADEDVVQVGGRLLQLPVVELQQLVGVVEVDHLGVAVERLDDVGQQDVHHLLQEGHGLGVSVHRGQKVCA